LSAGLTAYSGQSHMRNGLELKPTMPALPPMYLCSSPVAFILSFHIPSVFLPQDLCFCHPPLAPDRAMADPCSAFSSEASRRSFTICNSFYYLNTVVYWLFCVFSTCGGPGTIWGSRKVPHKICGRKGSKKGSVGWVWWYTLVIPATWEAEVGRSCQRPTG
jgi:hypothetical protein